MVLAVTSARLTSEQCETDEEYYHCSVSCLRNLEVRFRTAESGAISQSHERDRNNGLSWNR